jgi:ABC-type transporter MlaC component
LRQGEFVNPFTQLLEGTYADQIEAGKGNKIAYLNECTDKDYAEVATKVISPKGEKTSTTYKLYIPWNPIGELTISSSKT